MKVRLDLSSNLAAGILLGGLCILVLLGVCQGMSEVMEKIDKEHPELSPLEHPTDPANRNVIYDAANRD